MFVTYFGLLIFYHKGVQCEKYLEPYPQTDF